MDYFQQFITNFIEIQSKKAIQENKYPELITNLFNIPTYKNESPYALTGSFIIETLENIESNLYLKKYYGIDKEQISKFKNRFLSALSISMPFDSKKKEEYALLFIRWNQ